jgi:molybdenum cofactor biosynthesis enzyme
MRLVDADAVIKMIGIVVRTISSDEVGDGDIMKTMEISGLNTAVEIIESMTMFIPEQETVGSGLSVRLKNLQANPGTERNYGTGGEIIDL